MKKLVVDGYIVAIGENINGILIDVDECDAILSALEECPAYREGYALRLRDVDLVWEEYEVDPPEPPEPTDEDKAEAYDILTGVS